MPAWTTSSDREVSAPVFVFDLDDTLFPEMDFVRSAYRAVAARWGWHLLPAMLAAQTPRAAFDSTGVDAAAVLDLYRGHKPDISLPWRSLYTLASLHNRGCPLAVITDGRSVTQRNKLEALGIGRFVDKEDVFISEEVGASKVSGEAFGRVMSRYPGRDYVYVGDNPAKDFAPARKLGWDTVCLLDAGDNVHAQEFDAVAPECLPSRRIHSLTDILDIFDING